MIPLDRRLNYLLFICLFLSLFRPESGFYVPGVAPKEFKLNEPIEVKLNPFWAIKLTSVRTVLPYEYYALPFCRPQGELHYKSENIGEVMRGDRIVNTPYQVLMKEDTQCQFLCSKEHLKKTISKEETSLLHQRISEDYHVHLLIDNLPCATKYVVENTNEVFYDHGYKLGWVDASGRVFVNNHLELLIKYHEHSPGLFRVVGFEVTPKSIANDQYSSDDQMKCTIKEGITLLQLKENAENEIIWTYSVRWEASDVPWASRWDIYLSMRDVQIHWFSIFNSLIVVVCLTGFLSVIIIRTVRRDIAKYNRDENVEDTLEETGWKLVHGDVFRPPRYAMLLVNLIGTGIQLIGMTAITITFAMLGMLSPSSRGSLTSLGIFLYCFMGLIASYYAGRIYKTLRGNKPKRCAVRTALLFPAFIFGVGFFLNFFLIGKHSSGAIPFTTMLVLLTLLFGVDLPLVMIGFHFGFRKQMYTHPVRTNQIPRQVPDQPWYLKTFPCMLFAGLLPFGSVFIEVYFIFSAIWENHFYYLFGFLFIVMSILYVSCSQIAIVVTYFLLCAENYHWWWKSFAISGGSALYVMAYSIYYYYTRLHIIGFIPTLLYFSYSFLIALTFWILTGTIGFYAAYFFLRKIYAQVKID